MIAMLLCEIGGTSNESVVAAAVFEFASVVERVLADPNIDPSDTYVNEWKFAGVQEAMNGSVLATTGWNSTIRGFSEKLRNELFRAGAVQICWKPAAAIQGTHFPNSGARDGPGPGADDIRPGELYRICRPCERSDGCGLQRFPR